MKNKIRPIIVLIGIIIIATFLYYSFFNFEFSTQDIFEMMIFPLIIQPLIIILFFEVWRQASLLRDEDKKKIQLSEKELIEKYNLEKILKYKNFSSSSVPIFIPKKKLNIKDINCEIKNEFYQVPSILYDRIDSLIQVHQKSRLFNNTTLRLNNISKNKKLSLKFTYSDYLAHAITNLVADVSVTDTLSVRDLLEPGPKLQTLDIARPSNHLGISCLVITKDKKIIIPKRGKSVSYQKQKYSPSISGALTINGSLDKTKKPNLKSMLLSEAAEELSPKLKLRNIELLGIVRELARLGKPEIFFIAKCSHTESEIKSMINKNPKFKDENNSVEFIDLKNIENFITKKEKQLSTPFKNAILLYLNLKSL